jgi:hypothetical protein
MDLPFAISSNGQNTLGQSSSSSLVTASSQGSLPPLQAYEPPTHVNHANESKGIKSVFSQFGLTNLSPRPRTSGKELPVETEVIDFAYVQVGESDADEVDIIIPGAEANHYEDETPRKDVLSFLIKQDPQNESEQVSVTIEDANKLVEKAREAKKNDNLQEALDCHTEAAKFYFKAASMLKECDGKCLRLHQAMFVTDTHSHVIFYPQLHLRNRCSC